MRVCDWCGQPINGSGSGRHEATWRVTERASVALSLQILGVGVDVCLDCVGFAMREAVEAARIYLPPLGGETPNERENGQEASEACQEGSTTDLEEHSESKPVGTP